jgi:hypothetical protein
MKTKNSWTLDYLGSLNCLTEFWNLAKLRRIDITKHKMLQSIEIDIENIDFLHMVDGLNGAQINKS